jgi:3-oxoacyl-[acyl-carrier-protein] synthase II
MHAHESLRIVITGIGMSTPLGPDRESGWRALVAGRSAARWVGLPWWPGPEKMAGAPVCLPEARPFRHSEPLVELALTTATESLADAGLDARRLRERRVGVVFGTSKGGLHTFSRLARGTRTHNLESDARQTEPDPDDWLDVFPNQAAAAIARQIGSEGPVLCPVAACATGLAACLRGAELLQTGECDVVLAGSADASLQPALLGSFRRLGVLSREAEVAAAACRPFDRQRSGFVIGEGAACLVLERLDSALRRQATWYAEWLGGAMYSDAYELTQLDPAGASLRHLLQVLRRSCPSIPQYINLHGTGTATNDVVECQAIRGVFGAAADHFDCSSMKGGLGHLLGAAGSVELAATALAIRDQVVPPTVNLVERDLECPLNLTPQIARHRPIRHAWKLSMGFGGHIAGACLGQLAQVNTPDCR